MQYCNLKPTMLYLYVNNTKYYFRNQYFLTNNLKYLKCVHLARRIKPIS